jgi:Fe-S cluster biosynthesis and repair protein YggX
MTGELEHRIAQFQNMAAADPNNELGHFSLGKAYLEAGRFPEAVASFARALELNPSLSKAYHLCGEAAMKAGDTKKAVEVMARGVEVADELGDRMPRDAMAKLLNELGVAVPAFRSAPTGKTGTSAGAGGATGFRCSRCGRPEGNLDRPPFKGTLGARIAANVCTSCWRDWIHMGTKVINELGLQMNTPEAQAAYDAHLVEFLQIEDR